jgi:hypothetical protein
MLQLSAHRSGNVPPQDCIVSRFRNYVPLRLAVSNILDAAPLRQHVNLNAKPDVVQPQEERAVIQLATPGCSLGLLTPTTLDRDLAPGTPVLVQPDQTRPRIDIQLL